MDKIDLTNITLLESIKTRIAQQNPNNPRKAFGHRIAELRFKTKKDDKDFEEYTYVDPTNDNQKQWQEVIEQFVKHRPCHILLEFPNGYKYKNAKTGLIDADVEGSPIKILDIFDPETDKSKLNKRTNPQDLFTVG
tara:strand:+ start:112 stop:519 length:408 start_codon:yes stop_codon:yes gene_type:complete